MSMKGVDSMASAGSARSADITHDNAESPARYQQAEAMSPNLLDFGQKIVTVVDMSELGPIQVFTIRLEIPIGRGSHGEVDLRFGR